jgi:hypothetical protein
MDSEFAKLLFQVPEHQDPQDVYDQLIFDHRAFFLSKTPIAKVFKARLHKVLKMKQAAALLFPADIYFSEKEESFNLVNPVFTGNWLIDFNCLHQYRNFVKLEFNRVSNPSMWKVPLEKWLEVELEYAQLFASEEDDQTGLEVRVSNEPDAMTFLLELKQLSFEPTLENLRMKSKELPRMLCVERKRLHLYNLLNSTHGN